MPDRSYAVFILSHGRPDKVVTYRTIRRHGYTGPVYLLIDNEDPTADAYRKRFGDEWVIEFDKAAAARTFDEASTEPGRQTIVYARNACQEIARRMGLDYLLQLDDDYTAFQFRYFDEYGIHGKADRNLDATFEALFALLDDTGAACVAMSQGGDHIGGKGVVKGYRRKAMNSLFLRTGRPVRFLGKMNEDVTAYVLHGSRGDLFLTLMNVQLEQPATQQTPGGMSDAYAASGTYVKTFYTVMMCPSAVKVHVLSDQRDATGHFAPRIHHQVRWRNAVPMILGPEHRKPRPAKKSAERARQGASPGPKVDL